MLTIGLTGGIGSGKTCVSNLFAELGISIIDTDVISRDLVNNNQTVKKEIIDIFGDSIVTDNNNIDRKRLAQIVFKDASEQSGQEQGDQKQGSHEQDDSARKKLEKILHPKIRAEVKAQLQKLKSQSPLQQYVIIVVPLLFETNFRDFVSRVLVITADEKLRVERIIQRDDRTAEEIQAIIASQVTDERRFSGADDILENNDSVEDLVNQVQQLHEKYRVS